MPESSTASSSTSHAGASTFAAAAAAAALFVGLVAAPPPTISDVIHSVDHGIAALGLWPSAEMVAAGNLVDWCVTSECFDAAFRVAASEITLGGTTAPDLVIGDFSLLRFLLALAAADPDSEDPFQAGALGAVTYAKARVGDLNCYRRNAGMGDMRGYAAMHHLKNVAAQQYVWDMVRHGIAYEQPNCTLWTKERAKWSVEQVAEAARAAAAAKERTAA